MSADNLDKGRMSSLASSASTSHRRDTCIPEDGTIPDHHFKISRLSDDDLSVVCHDIGAVRSGENQTLIHPTSRLYPPKGLPDGLYKDVIRRRVIAQYLYYACATWCNVSLVTQLVLGAAMTALGCRTDLALVITVMAAANTVNAGLLALMHNSGLPDRYKKDWDEFDKVESFFKELIRTGIVREGMTRDEVTENCYAKFRRAKSTVSKNKPDSYVSSKSRSLAPSGHWS